MSRRRRAWRARLSCAALILLAGCASTMSSRAFPSCRACRPSISTGSPGRECASFSLVTTDVEMSGALTRPDGRQGQEAARHADPHHRGHGRGTGAFRLRFAQDGSVIPATLRFSRAWVPEAVRLDNPALDSSDQQSARLDAAAARPTLHAVGAVLRPLDGRRDPALRHWLHRDAGHERERAGDDDAPRRGLDRRPAGRGVRLERGTTEFLFTGDPGRGVPGRMVADRQGMARSCHGRLAARDGEGRRRVHAPGPADARGVSDGGGAGSRREYSLTRLDERAARRRGHNRRHTHTVHPGRSRLGSPTRAKSPLPLGVRSPGLVPLLLFARVAIEVILTHIRGARTRCALRSDFGAPAKRTREGKSRSRRAESGSPAPETVVAGATRKVVAPQGIAAALRRSVVPLR